MLAAQYLARNKMQCLRIHEKYCIMLALKTHFFSNEDKNKHGSWSSNFALLKSII